MSDLEPEDELGNGWLAIAFGIASLLFSWYLYARVGADLHLVGKAAIANSGWGRKLLSGLGAVVGMYLIFRGIAKLRSDD